MVKCVLAIDLGTTGNRAMLFDHEQRVVAKAYQEFRQHYPQPGWVEHDPDEIWHTTAELVGKAMRSARAKPGDVNAIGITNQRETTILWNRETGRPVSKAIVWQDRRTAPLCKQLIARGYEQPIKRKTGLLIDAYFSASKIQWLLDHAPQARKLANQGKLAFGTVDTWVLWNLTGGKVHATDYSNASRTMLFNIHSLKWDKQLLGLFNIPPSILPEVRPSSGSFGIAETSGSPITGIAGDQQAAMFGQCCFSKGMVKTTYGTGCFLDMNVGTQPIRSKHRLLTTIAWGIGNKVEYALEGSVFMGGAAVQWLRDGLGIISNAAESEQLARQVSDNGGVYFVPALVGLGAPHWDMEARGTIVGITRGTTRQHLARATLEAIAYQVTDVISAMSADSGYKLHSIRVDGGASANDFLMQFQSDIIGSATERPSLLETTALGAASLAGLATGFWKDKQELESKRHVQSRFSPRMKAQTRKELYSTWQRAVQRAKRWIV